VGLSPESGQIVAQFVVHAFDVVGVRFASGVPLCRKDGAVALPVVGVVADVIAARNLRTQRLGCSGVTIAQRPAEYAAGSTINSPPQPDGIFF